MAGAYKAEKNHDIDTISIGIGYGAQPLVRTVPTQKVSSMPTLIVTVIDVRGLGSSTQGDLSHDPVSIRWYQVQVEAPEAVPWGWGSRDVGAFDKDPTATGQLPRRHDANNDQLKIYE